MVLAAVSAPVLSSAPQVADAESRKRSERVWSHPRRGVALGCRDDVGAAVRGGSGPAFPGRSRRGGADRADAGGLALAAEAELPTFVVEPGEFPDRVAWNVALADQVAEWQPDLICCVGFMRILAPEFVNRFAPRILNSHPSLLPAFPGAHAVADTLTYGVKVTGATIHVMDTGVDTGPIVAQRAVIVRPDDDETQLHERIKQVERRMLVEVVADLATIGWRVDGRKVWIP